MRILKEEITSLLESLVSVNDEFSKALNNRYNNIERTEAVAGYKGADYLHVAVIREKDNAEFISARRNLIDKGRELMDYLNSHDISIKLEQEYKMNENRRKLFSGSVYVVGYEPTLEGRHDQLVLLGVLDRISYDKWGELDLYKSLAFIYKHSFDKEDGEILDPSIEIIADSELTLHDRLDADRFIRLKVLDPKEERIAIECSRLVYASSELSFWNDSVKLFEDMKDGLLMRGINVNIDYEFI